MIANHKGEIPFVLLLIPFLLGLVTGLNYLSNGWINLLLILFFSVSTLFIVLNLVYKRFEIYKVRWAGGVLINLILFFFGCICIINYNELNRTDHFSKVPAQYLVLKISNEPVLKNGLLHFDAKVEAAISKGKNQPVSGNLLISIKDSAAKSLYYGDILFISAKYSEVEPPYNPAEFNYKRYLADKNIHYQAFLYHGQYTVTSHNTGNLVIAYALQLRRRLVEKLKANMHNPQAIAVASTLILGYRADLDNDVLQAYSKTGTVYVLTVSGAQVAIIYFLLSTVLGFTNRFKYGKLLRAVLIITALCYYALLTGLTVSVCRAVLMLSLIIIGRSFSRYINSLNILAVSAFVLLLYDPLYITDVGFQLAYLAVAGLIIFRPMIYGWFKFKNRAANRLWELASLSIAAQLITFPLSAFYFHQFPVYFLLTNLLVFIPATVIMYAGLAYLLFPQIPFFSKFLGFMVEQTVRLMNKVLAVLEHAPFASIDKIWLNQIEYLLLYIIIISLFCFGYYKRTWLLRLSLICLLFFSVSISLKKINALKSNSITFLNLHKHVGLVMKRGNDAVVISDLADTDKNYRYSVQPYLDSIQANPIEVYRLKQDIRLGFVLKQYNYIQFMDKSVIILDKQAKDLSLDEKLKADYIYLTGNPYQAINMLDKNFYCRTLVIDAGNSNNFISMATVMANRLKVNFAVLKRNKAVVVVSND